MEMFDLREVIQNLLQEHQSLAHDMGISLIFSGAHSAWGYFDKGRIEQAVTNLICNAIKYGQGRPVIVSCELSSLGACIRVCDSGIGMSTETKAKVFEFGSRDKVAAPFFPGNGFGLWMTKTLVEAMNGKIFVNSKLGEGSTFNILLPITGGN